MLRAFEIKTAKVLVRVLQYIRKNYLFTSYSWRMCKVKIIINTKQTQQPLQKWLIDVNLKVTSTKIITSENVAFNTLFENFFIPWKIYVPSLRYSIIHIIYIINHSINFKIFYIMLSTSGIYIYIYCSKANKISAQ